MTISIQPASAADLEAVAALITQLRPDRAISADELGSMDRDQRQLAYHHARWVLRGPREQLLGFGQYMQSPGQYHPRKFVMDLLLHPDARGRGLGRQLYDTVLEGLRAHNPLSVRGAVREDDPSALQFFEQRGFREHKRYWTSWLDLTRFDAAPYARLQAQVAEQGVELLSVADLQAQDPSGWKVQLHRLFSEVRLDVPRSDPATPIRLEQYDEWVLQDPGFLPDGYLLARHGDQLIGSSDVYRSAASPDLFIGLTGVRRAWRGRGVATALKLAGIRYAQAAGAERLWTDNESGNAPILRINEQLGFVREPALINLLKVWPD
ncbi:GNAT family N-acetyltransferase [Deinococcus sonorensis]|uniref:GNAT family N-acetyltransferase n=2 Tax=Deinococcus sonorensis TaxID=309891 RepID=A0AAU7UCB2_9DEIO